MRENKSDYRSRHPEGYELILTIEVSDSTAAFDLSRKAEIYANAGVPEYWVIELNRRSVVVHRDAVDGRYHYIQPFAPGAIVPVAGQTIAVNEIFPE